MQADVSTEGGAAAAAAAVLDRLGGVDIVVHNVGGSSSSTEGVLTMVDEDWRRALDANLMAAVRLDRVLVPSMVEQGSGAIVHISSIQRRFPLDATVPYAAAKAALTVYSKGLANALAPHGVRVNTVAPGFIETSAATRLIERLADGSDVAPDDARAGSWTRWAAFRWVGPVGPTRWPSWWRSLSRTARRRSPAPSTSSMAERCGRSRSWPGGPLRHDPDAVRAIPSGEVRTYGDVSPGAPRLAGRALGSVHAPDVPWWRVVRADGSLAAGADQEARLRARAWVRAGDPPRVDLRLVATL